MLLPAEEHLVSYPVDMTPELTWRWHGLYWRRWSRLNQRDLEQWAGTGHRETPAEGLNQYLFSAFGDANTLECRTTSRWAILLTFSGVTRLGGLLLIYIPALRHAGLLFALGIGLGTVIVMAPDLALAVVSADVSSIGCASFVSTFYLLSGILPIAAMAFPLGVLGKYRKFRW